MDPPGSKDSRKRPAQAESVEDIDWSVESIWQEVGDLFFQPSDYFRANSPEFQDFREFFLKYLKYRKFQKTSRKPDPTSLTELLTERRLSLPSTYDARYKVNFSIQTDDRSRRRRQLTDTVVTEVRRVLHMFEEFMQRKNFNRLMKIRQDRSNLPIAQYETQIIQTLATHQVVVIAGDTGCGKSTQVPQFLLKAGYDKIACTQPRRIATMSLCRRVSYETLNEFGSQVAYQIRFETSKAADTRILFLTEGLLLRQLASDPLLSHYSVIIIDEVHERHIQGDFLLGILRRVLPRRRDLKIVLMSATINLDLFSGAFWNCPVIRVPGRMYPIEVHYRPIAGERNDEALFATEKAEGKSIRSMSTRETDARPYLRILQEVDQQVPANERGDLLIFMSGIKEISTIAEPLRLYGKESGRWIVLMCHSSLSVEEQEKVFDLPPEGVRKCIIATNICETAVTIDGIRFVVDSGKVKEMGFDTDARMQSLQEYWVSKASAEQRKGRAGRTGPGVCYRLYARNEFDHFLDYSLPEIRRIPLEAIALQIKALNLGDPRLFEFVERPEGEAINTAMLNLKSHQLINNDNLETITPLGEVLSRLPVDISIGKMLVLGAVFRIVDPVLSIAAALSVQSPFVRIESQEEATAAKRRFESSHGDPFMLLNIFDEWVKVKADNNENSRKWCRRHFLEEQRLYEMAKLKRQFREILVDSGVLAVDSEQEEEDRRRKQRTDYTRRDLRRLQVMQSKERGRRVLKFEYREGEAEGKEEEADEEEDNKLDIRSMDFALTHNISELARASSRGLTVSEVNLVKMILASGFYPNVSVPDEANSSRKESDSIFHTKWQRMVLLHPQSSLAGQALTLAPSDVLVYQYVLRTNKSYLVNPMPASAAHTLLLYSHCIDTTPDCSRLMIDNWIEFHISNPKAGERLLLVVHQLRLMLQNLLRARLTASAESRHFSLAGPAAPPPPPPTTEELAERHGLPAWARRVAAEAHDLSIACSEELLSTKLAEFLETPVPATWERAKQTNLAAMFVLKAESTRSEELKSFADAQAARAKGDDPMAQVEEEVLIDARFEEKKGGVRLCSWLRYASLQAERPAAEGISSHMRKHWDCPQCAEHFVFSGTEIDEHKRLCRGRSLKEITTAEIAATPLAPTPAPAPPPVANVARSSYHCEACDKTFLFTPPEVLRHKRSHSAPSAPLAQPV